MNRHFFLRRPFLLLFLVAELGLAGCATDATSPGDEIVAGREIRARIADIRRSILARSAAGIVRDGTADWSFTGPDGVTFDRAGFVIRTEALFARIVAIESLETRVDLVTFPSASNAQVEITQTMVRTERPPEGGTTARVRLRYRELHTWVRTPEGWKVRRVQFIGTPDRTILTGG